MGVEWQGRGLDAVLGGVNREIIRAAGARRMGEGRGAGARLPASVAGASVRLCVIDDLGVPVTPLGYKTARRTCAPILEALDPRDPRRVAADLLAASWERLGASGGVDYMGGDSKGGISDGGATTKIKHAERIRTIAGAVNGWPRGRDGKLRRGHEAAVLRVQRGGPASARAAPERKEIKAFAALVALCVEGRGLYDVLRAHGWSAQSYNARRLAVGVLAALDDAAEALGLGRADPSKGVDR
jgi:hypothetical protein